MTAASATSVQSVEASVTQNVSVESGSSGVSSQQTALTNAQGGVTPHTSAPQTGPTDPTTTTQPTGGKTQSEPIIGTPTTTTPSGVISLKIPRP